MHLPNSTMVLFSHRRLPWLSPSAATANWRANTHYYSVYQALTGDEIPSGITLLWRMNPTVKNTLQPRVWNLFSPPRTSFHFCKTYVEHRGPGCFAVLLSGRLQPCSGWYQGKISIETSQTTLAVGGQAFVLLLLLDPKLPPSG